MKKIIAVLAVVVSAGAFAQNMGNSAEDNYGRGSGMDYNQDGMMNQATFLNLEQEAEYNELQNKQMNAKQRLRLDIKEVELKIQREMISKNPNQRNIDKLIDQKAKLQAEHQKNMLKFRLDMKEKFGIEMTGDKKCCKTNSHGMRN